MPSARPTLIDDGNELATLATFQAVAQRAADAYIDTEAVMLTARQAAWRLGAGFDADEALDTAKFWAAEGGFWVAHARSICTAASASTPSTRCSGTSAVRDRSSSRSAAPRCISCS